VHGGQQEITTPQHFLSHQGADGLVVNEHHQTEVNQQGREQQKEGQDVIPLAHRGEDNSFKMALNRHQGTKGLNQRPPAYI